MTWTVSTLGVATQSGGLIQTGPFGSQLHQSDYLDDGIPVIMPKDIADGSVDVRTVARVSEETAMRLSRHQLVPRAIVLPRRGEITKRALIRDDQEGWLCGTGCLQIVVEGTPLVPEYLYYYMEQDHVVRWLEQHAVGTTMLNLSASIVSDLPVRFPPRDQQTRIADILSAYDDLIENNRRRRALLEEAARQLYREWFVRLRFPGHEHTRITDGVPEGWVRKPLEELADFRLGKMLDEKKNKGDLMPYLANVNVRWGGIDLANLREMRFEENELDTFGLRYGDIIMCEGGEPGRCALWKEQLPGMMIQKAIHRIRAHPEVSHVFLYCALRHKGESGEMSTLFTGATIKHLPREKLALVQLVIPPTRLMALFAEQVDALERQIGLLEATNRRASQARDLLLPRLMSGEIAV